MSEILCPMSIRPIVNIPDPILRQVSKPVERFDDALQTLLDDMLETMYDAPGIGLAAIQLAVPLRIFTIDVSPRVNEEEENESVEDVQICEPDPIFLINPEILSVTQDTSHYDEGCLSIPDYYAEVERPAGCKIKFLDRSGKEQILDADGILSTCVQHEFDHLQGILFIDHISKLKRDMVIKKFTKIAKQSRAVI